MRAQKTFNIDLEVLNLLEDFCRKYDYELNTGLCILIRKGVIKFKEEEGKENED